MTLEDIRLRLRALGPPSRNARVTLAIFLGVIVTWLVTPLLATWSGGRIALPIEAVALAGGSACSSPA